MIYGGHLSHMNFDTLKYGRENNVTILKLHYIQQISFNHWMFLSLRLLKASEEMFSSKDYVRQDQIFIRQNFQHS